MKISRTSAVLGVVLLLTAGSVAYGQAWTPGKHKGTFGFQFQSSDVDDHLFSTSNLGPSGEDIGTDKLDFGQIDSRVAILDFDYGLTPKLALNANAAYVESRYIAGGFGEAENPSLDDGSYHGKLQDFRLTARYAFTKGRTTITPALGIQTAISDYPIIGHAAVGRNLDELQASLNVGHVFGSGRPRAYVQGIHTYSLVEEVDGVSTDRSNTYGEVGYFVTPRFNINVGTSYQDTHGGIDWAHDIHDEGDFHTHDQLAAARWWRAGAGLWLQVGAGGGWFLSVIKTLEGANTHEATSISTGLSWRFDKGLNFITNASLSNTPNAQLKNAIVP